MKYLKMLERTELKKVSGETEEVVELAEVDVNEEEVECRAEGETQFEEEGGDFDLEQVRQGREEEEMNYMVKTLGTFELGSWEEATSKAGKAPTATKWIDRVMKSDDCREFVRCRLVARDFLNQDDSVVRGDATAGGKESIVCIRCMSAREETRTGPGRGEPHVHRR